MRIIGIDPGLRNTGWGIIETYGDKIQEVANGVCETKKTDSLALRLKMIFEKLSIVITTYKPNHAAVENTFVNKDDYEKWACLRPMTPNMLPVVGKVKGLWVNSGAGHLGWTMGMALAERLANDLQKSR